MAVYDLSTYDSIDYDVNNYDYKQLEYIESTGTQYINTGITTKRGIRVVLDVISNNAKIIYGTIHNNVGGGCWFGRTGNTFWGSTYSSARYDYTLQSNTRYEIDQYFGKYLDLNGTRLTTFSDTNPSSSAFFHLFGAYDLYTSSVDINNYAGTYKLYSCKIYENDKLVRDFIPAKKSSDIGLYDKVNNQFYLNNGSGSFVAGDTVSDYITTKSPVKKVYYVEDKTYDYERLEYIESTGTQYINTGYKVTSTIGSDSIATWVSNATNGYNYLIGSRSGSMGYYQYCLSIGTSGNLEYHYAGYTINSGYKINFGTQYHIKYNYLNDSKLIVNDTEITKSSTYSLHDNDYTLYLFAKNENGSPNVYSYAKMKMYQCTISDGDKIVRQYVPARRKADSVVGMYDMVENKFYPNSGSGVFTAGGVVDDHIDVPSGVKQLVWFSEEVVYDEGVTDYAIQWNRYAINDGWYSGSGTLYINSNNIAFQTSPRSNFKVYFNHMFDMTSFSKLIIEYQNNGNNGLWLSLQKNINSYSYNEVTYNLQRGVNTRTRYEYDISNFTGEYYICISSIGNMTMNIETTYIWKVVLE